MTALGAFKSPRSRRRCDSWSHDRPGGLSDDLFDYNDEDLPILPLASDHKRDANHEADNACTTLVQAILLGVINAVMAVPSMYGYAAVIFQHPTYAGNMGALAKLVCLSSAVHQICFMLFSQMSFAIGQVQDAGLIFLSHIATNIAVSLTLNDGATETEVAAAEHRAVATTVVTLGLGTAALGIVLVFIGRARLAKYIAYLPMPVIGGYLAFIGLFCIEAGFSLCVGFAVNGVLDWPLLFSETKYIILCVPAILTGVLFCAVCHVTTNAMVLPVTMVAVPVFFYVVLYASGYSMDDARDYGWMGAMGEPVSVTSLFGLYDVSDVDWSLLPAQLPVWASMVFVVAFSSCLDVAAIEMDIKRPLDVNQELGVVGVSNIVSGICGGFTGSYIFSQTIFTCRSRCHDRRIGAVVAISEIAVVIMQVNLLAYVPLFFFAATLTFIGFDLLFDWLIKFRAKLELSEYLVVWLTFIAIQAVGLNLGLFTGIVGTALNFIWVYSQQNNMEVVEKKSLVVRTPHSYAALQNSYRRGTIVTLELSGGIFFMQSLRILEEVRTVLRVDDGADSSRASVAFPSPRSRAASYGSSSTMDTDSLGGDVMDDPLPGTKLLNYTPDHRQKGMELTSIKPKPKFLVLDFTRVTSVDASAVNSCFLVVRRLCVDVSVKLLFAGARSSVFTQLSNHGALGGEDSPLSFRTVHMALGWCESAVLSSMRPKKEKPSNGKVGEKSLESLFGSGLRQWLETVRPGVEPAELRPWLLVGGANHADDQSQLRRLGVGYVLNVSDEELQTTAGKDDNNNPNSIEYKHLMATDPKQGTVGISQGVFDDAASFARLHALPGLGKEGNTTSQGAGGGSPRLLVHGIYGTNHAPTVAMAMVMQLEGVGLLEAWRQMREAQPSVRLEKQNCKELVRLEKLLQSKKEGGGTVVDDAEEATLMKELYQGDTTSIDELKTYFEHKTFSDGAQIYATGSPASTFFVVLSGEVNLFRSDGTLDIVVLPGNLFGYLDSQNSRPRQQTAVAASGEVELASISQASLTRMNVESTHLALKVTQALYRQTAMELDSTE